MNTLSTDPTFTVRKIVVEKDRQVLYSTNEQYHVIAPTDEHVRIGDTVRYEPYGYNFGWFKERITTE